MKAPFPFFGGKSRVANLVWSRFGQINQYIEPFAGSLAVLLGSPYIPPNEIVNDLDSYIANFWRALQNNPEEVAYYADYPISEVDLNSRHMWLINQEDFRNRMLQDPDYYDAKIAGWWVWGISCWIGSGWCSLSSTHKQIPVLTRKQGVNSTHIPSIIMGNQLGTDSTPPSNSKWRLPGITYKDNKGVNCIEQVDWNRHKIGLYQYMYGLSERLRDIKVCCGDWSRVVKPSITINSAYGYTGIFLDPPYPEEANRSSRVYSKDNLKIAWEVREWALEYGDIPILRIALCGYNGIEGYKMPDNWEKVSWKASGGYGNQDNKNENRFRETIWFSPGCLKQKSIFDS